ncbi:class I SAM-dependent rRNA methyltransferase [Altererythrobacter sp. BO-6]|uniref:class I SAM-dependent methyltransferase n=1 Tax=Altererythrobacter sp. BO-6 TaxID=2604537 RepID=UPI0013E13FDC|nr:class I SAM-dependent methyltransferase [Altererythrobacter sp. BO-6]QIG53322.1 class I SAM-dependent rRNA methyltransferase [Altererythrobacter sp. BO-6]
MAKLVRDPLLMVGEGWEGGYRLLDSGHGRKFESFGPHAFIRPEPQAMWTPRLADWPAMGEFIPGSDEDGGGRWQLDPSLPQAGWPVSWNEVNFTAQPTPFRHLQFFPDMAPVWDWMRAQLSGCDDAETLNLFGYTGVGSLALSRHGKVTHVDASKKSVAQARENAALSGMEEAPIRWLVDDAAKFTAREVRRARRYDGVILDPPKFGRGPNNETWRLEEGLPGLLADCRKLLDSESRFLFLTVYAVRMSSLALAGLVEELFRDLPGTIEHGDLAVQETGEGARLLPTAIFARWSNSG